MLWTTSGSGSASDSVLFPSGFSSSNSFFAFLVTGAGDFRQGKFATDEQRQINFIDNLSVTSGSHQLKFGVDYRWLAPFSSPLSYDQSGIFSGMSDSPEELCLEQPRKLWCSLSNRAHC